MYRIAQSISRLSMTCMALLLYFKHLLIGRSNILFLRFLSRSTLDQSDVLWDLLISWCAVVILLLNWTLRFLVGSFTLSERISLRGLIAQWFKGGIINKLHFYKDSWSIVRNSLKILQIKLLVISLFEQWEPRADLAVLHVIQ